MKKTKKVKVAKDAMINLNSKGNSAKIALNEIQHLIDDVSGKDDIFFVDDEQTKDKLKQRGLSKGEDSGNE